MAVTQMQFYSAVLMLGCALFYPIWLSVGSLEAANKSILGLYSFGAHHCKSPTYQARVITYDPLIIHLQDFISPYERAHLLKISENTFEESLVTLPNGTRVPYEGRTSSTSFLPLDDPVVKCISERVSEFQGYHPTSYIEPFQATKYGVGQEFRAHFDWHHPRSVANWQNGTNRISTFFATLEADCERCGTQFPQLAFDFAEEDDRWCEIVDCEEDALTIKPIPGSAVFWRNLHLDGTGDHRTLHAGLPLKRGHKVGLNIWSKVDVGIEEGD